MDPLPHDDDEKNELTTTRSHSIASAATDKRSSSGAASEAIKREETAIDDHGGTANDLEKSITSCSNSPPYSVFTLSQKRFIIFMTAWGGFFSPLSANIYFPALNLLAADYHVSNSLINLTLTSYMIFQGLAPTLMGDLADMAGRRPAYIVGFTIYIGACVGIALQNSFAALFVLRCLQSTGSSATIALGTGIVADVSVSDERGTYMGWSTAGALLGPAIGPVLGGILSQFLGWRSIFWFLVIFVGIYLVPFLVAFPETGRNVVGNGSIPPPAWNMSVLNVLAARRATKAESSLSADAQYDREKAAEEQRQFSVNKRKIGFPNPLNSLKLVLEKDMGLLLFYNSLVYTAFYDVTASTPYLFQQIYGYNELQIGLAFIPFGVGCLLAAIINGRLMDWNFRRVAGKAGIVTNRKRGTSLRGFPLEKARVQIALPEVLVGAVCILIYGWIMQAEVHVAAPLILQFIMGLTLTGSFNCMSVMLVDNYPQRPATATAANNLVRCSLGAAGTAIIIIMIDSMGRGWCFTFIAAVVLLASPILWVLLRWGPRWRAAREDKVASQ